MKKKIWSGMKVLLAAMLIISMLAGCSQGTAPGNSSEQSANNESSASNENESVSSSEAEVSKEQVTLTIEASQQSVHGNEYAFSEENIAEFEKTYPNVKVEVVLDPDEQSTSILQTKLAAGQPSDILAYNKVSAENELNAVNNFVDLSNEAFVGNLIDPSLFKAPDGKIYGFAMKSTSMEMGIVYDKAMFKEMNVSVPKTFDEFVQACATIKENGVIPIYAPFKDNYTFQMYTSDAWGYYASKVEPDLWEKINSNEVAWTEVPAFEESLTKLYSLYTDGYMQETLLSDDYASFINVFGNKQCAMMAGSNYTIEEMEEKLPDGEYGLFPFPMFEGENAYITVGQLDCMFFIPKDAAHVEEAKAYLDFLAQPEQCDRAQATAAFSPSIKGAKSPELTPFKEEMAEYYNDGHVVVEMNTYMYVDLTDLWKYYQDMFAGAKTPKDVLQEWDAKFSDLMQQKGKEGF